MPYEVFAVEPFDKTYEKLDKTEKQWIDQVKRKLKHFPTGKILLYSWFREKKYSSKRLYYIIDEERKRILLIMFTSKKDQQKSIDYILDHRKELFLFLRKL